MISVFWEINILLMIDSGPTPQGVLMNTIWKDLHANYQAQDWVDKPSLFAETAVQYFPKTGRILELGAGHGQIAGFL